ncbi:MAG: CHAT domain-containing tetratricopeptide repeat protein, partial [Cyanobacteria bacterium J06600_6]
KADNLETAIACYKRALIIHTQQDFPIECLGTASNLGSLYFKCANWQLAIEAYNTAIEAVEQSRAWASNDRNKQEIISNAIEVYLNIVQACINLGQIDKAIEYVERGKARNLVDLLATKDLYPKGDIPEEIIIRLRTLRQEKIAEEKSLSQQRYFSNNFNNFDSGEDRRFTDSVSRNKALDTNRFNLIRQELDNLIAQHIQPIDPSFKLTQNKLFSFEQIQKTLPTQQTALIEWFIGNGNLTSFIVTSQQSMPVHFSYTKEQLNVLTNTVNQYFDTYIKRDRSWQTVLPDLLTQLAENLQLESIVEQIKLLIPDCNQLILVPHRWLHLLPIHALPLSDGKCFLDLFPQGVSYAPSIQLLQITQIQNKPQLTNFFAVQNPTEDLDFTNVEVQAVRSQFQPNDDVLEKEQATKSALTNERLGQANLTHFSCHGYFNFEKPELSALLLANSKVETNIEKEDKEEEETRYLPSRDGGSVDLKQCLTLGEIFIYDLTNCRLVTLSACETGLTDFRSLSDEYIGLPSGFLFAGSPSVVSSLWKVDDLSTSLLMIKFYQNLREIDSVPLALNQAQLWLRDLTRAEFMKWSRGILSGKLRASIAARFLKEEYPFASPYYWGAFCAVGS